MLSILGFTKSVLVFRKYFIKIAMHSLLYTSFISAEHLSLAVNVLTNSPKISDLTKRELSQLSLSQDHDTIEKSAAVQISAVSETRKRVDCGRVL